MKDKIAHDHPRYVNLACGQTYINHPAWINLDFQPSDDCIMQANLLSRLPLHSNSIDVVYCSHFVEHIPIERLDDFLRECIRILKPKTGVLRLVLPDFLEMAKAYVYYREAGQHNKADFVVTQIIDQCVRRYPGGLLGRQYHELKNSPETDEVREMTCFIETRNGERIRPETIRSRSSLELARETIPIPRKPKDLPTKIRNQVKKRLESWRLRLGILLLPNEFVAQNVSFASLGEKHQWLWDFHQIAERLSRVGFVSCHLVDASTTQIPDFPLYPLDITAEHKPRKGLESMYIECQKQ